VKFNVNGSPQQLEIGVEVQPWHTLLETLRDALNLQGTKIGCTHGGCGFCTVLREGNPVLACTTLTLECEGANITTIEGLQDPATGKLDPLQQSFIDNFAFECGMCTPSMIMSAKALLNENDNPTEQEVKKALSGNICRCGPYPNIIKAVLEAAKVKKNA
jgi:aerobic-type carbon monoxide dehydrogenase small subunit (CoxS/CutS family)